MFTDMPPFVWIFALTLVACFAYIAPSLVAFHREHEDKAKILTLNVLLGWTIVGWGWCLKMALADE